MPKNCEKLAKKGVLSYFLRKKTRFFLLFFAFKDVIF